MKYDLFISHASEDKQDFVEPLVAELQKLGLQVWYDRFVLTIGDSLRERIDEGLAQSKFGVVVLSKSFFEKSWPKSELDGLVSRQNSSGEKVVLPIWHGLDYSDVKRYSPTLAALLAANSKSGVEAVARQLHQAVRRDSGSSSRPISVFQVNSQIGLREECLGIIRDENKQAWIDIIERTQESISHKLIKWKAFGEAGVAGLKTGDDARIHEWEDAVKQAIVITLPGCVPIFSAIEGRNRDFWQDSIGLLRQLAILEGDMGGGTNWVFEIGRTLLAVAGSVGMALAAKTKQTSMIEEWLSLRMTVYSNYGNFEEIWLDTFSAFSSPPGYDSNRANPFEFLISLYKFVDIQPFFSDVSLYEKSLFISNLIQSMIDFKNCITSFNEQNEISGTLRPTVLPFWVLMTHQEFQSRSLWYFGDSREVIKLLSTTDLPANTTENVRRIWSRWKTWKKCCSDLMSNHGRYDYFHARHLNLPGEPIEK